MPDAGEADSWERKYSQDQGHSMVQRAYALRSQPRFSPQHPLESPERATAHPGMKNVTAQMVAT